MAEFFMEILSEEMPARMQPGARAQLKERLVSALDSYNLPYDGMNIYTTPRRLIAHVVGLPTMQPKKYIELKGPSVKASDAAIQGFLSSTALTMDDLKTRELPKKGTFFFAPSVQGGIATSALLSEVLFGLMRSFKWPKSMRWGASSFKWVRPLKSLLAVFDGEIIPLDAPHPHVTVGDITMGHRFLAPKSFAVRTFDAYKTQLASAYVIIDQDARRNDVRIQLEAHAASANLDVVLDEQLLEEVVGLVEWPVIFRGHFSQEYLSFPAEILVTSMRTHQKCFATKKNGRLAPYFFFVSNMVALDGGEQIIRGNEKTLTARLADASFFWKQDQKRTLDTWSACLEQQAFHAQLGTMLEKVTRLERLVQNIAPELEDAEEAARLCKADLATAMVGEFPELQGITGCYYAIAQGKSDNVALAIREHYFPKGPSDVCPNAPSSRVLALADKLDTLIAFFSVGIMPTSSKDPFALRRSALGCLRLLIENKWSLDIKQTMNFAYDQLNVPGKQEKAKTLAFLWKFLQDRFHVYMKDKGYRYDHILSVLNHSEMVDFYVMTNALSVLKNSLKPQKAWVC